MDSKERNIYLIKFGENFRKIRLSKNYTQAKLAIDLNTDFSLISRIERGLVNTTVIKLKEVSDILDVPILSFFDF